MDIATHVWTIANDSPIPPDVHCASLGIQPMLELFPHLHPTVFLLQDSFVLVLWFQIFMALLHLLHVFKWKVTAICFHFQEISAGPRQKPETFFDSKTQYTHFIGTTHQSTFTTTHVLHPYFLYFLLRIGLIQYILFSPSDQALAVFKKVCCHALPLESHMKIFQ